MTHITMLGKPVKIIGTLPKVGDIAPDFLLVATDLSEKTLQDYQGKRKILSIFPSVDTGICSQTIPVFNDKASQLKNTVVLCISADVPFAQQRFCTTNNMSNIETLSNFRNTQFAQQYGVLLGEGDFAGLNTRTVIVLDENNTVLYAERVSELTNEPNYEAIWAVLT